MSTDTNEPVATGEASTEPQKADRDSLIAWVENADESQLEQLLLIVANLDPMQAESAGGGLKFGHEDRQLIQEIQELVDDSGYERDGA